MDELCLLDFFFLHNNNILCSLLYFYVLSNVLRKSHNFWTLYIYINLDRYIYFFPHKFQGVNLKHQPLFRGSSGFGSCQISIKCCSFKIKILKCRKNNNSIEQQLEIKSVIYSPETGTVYHKLQSLLLEQVSSLPQRKKKYFRKE